MNEFSLTYKNIFIFWVPITITWLMRAIVEGPIVTAVISRLAEPKYNLAAYGVAFAFTLIIEAPLIMIMAAAAALVKDRDAFFKFKNFTYGLNILITLIMGILLLPDTYNYVVGSLMGLSPDIVHMSHITLLILLPWPAAVGYKRFYYGILARNKLTKRIAYGTIIHLVFIIFLALFLYTYAPFSGAYVGALIFSSGAILEAIAGRLLAQSTVNKIKNTDKIIDEKKLTYPFILKFYIPLALSPILSLGVRPVVNYFLGQSAYSIESLAVLPVAISSIFIFRCFGLAYYEATIALIGDHNEEYVPLRNYAIGLGGLMLLSLGFIAFTPFNTFWFHKIFGLSKELTDFSIIPLQIMAIIPALEVFLAFLKAVMVNKKYTIPVIISTGVESFLVLLVLFFTVTYFSDVTGAISGGIGFAAGTIGASIYILFAFRYFIKKANKMELV